MDFSRYHRQMLLPDFGPEGQSRLAASHAMLIGCGALGCPAADILVRAGVGIVSLVDRDIVEITNLQRQTLYDERDARDGVAKAEAAARRLRSVNAGVKVVPIVEDFNAEGAVPIMASHPRPGVVLDCTDNFQTRYLINDAAVSENIPYIYGGAVGTGGMGMVIIPGATPCLRCVFPDAPAPGTMPTCDTAGILASVSISVAAWQATEAIKVLLGRAERRSTGLVQFDLWCNEHRRIDIGSAPRPDCPCCGQRNFDYLEGLGEAGGTVLCGRNSVQVAGQRGVSIDLAGLATRLASHGEFTLGDGLVRGRLAGSNGEAGLELTIFRDGRAIVGGTTDVTVARTIYARYVGA